MGVGGPSEYAVRPAQPADLPLLAEIEGAADQLFMSVFGDLDWDPPAEGADRAAEPGFLLVAGDPPVGFAHVLYLEGAAHLEQLAVHPSAMGQGIGTALLEAACETAHAAGHQALSLSTFADVPWNAPWYADRGFEVVSDPLPYQQRLRELEQELGLDRHGPRVVMSRTLGPVSEPATAAP
jgi:GNAT superfamily N-acetyltransferase